MRYDSTKALRNKEVFYLPIEKYLNKLFIATIYRPLLDIVSEEIGDTWLNSKEDLIRAILSGRVQYTPTQHFEGKFNSLISNTFGAEAKDDVCHYRASAFICVYAMPHRTYACYRQKL